jgi:hypothetical protein
MEDEAEAESDTGVKGSAQKTNSWKVLSLQARRRLAHRLQQTRLEVSQGPILEAQQSGIRADDLRLCCRAKRGQEVENLTAASGMGNFLGGALESCVN